MQRIRTSPFPGILNPLVRFLNSEIIPCFRSDRVLGHQFSDSLSDCTSSCNSSILSSNASRSSQFSSMSSLQSSLGSSSQSSLFTPNIPLQSSPASPLRIISRERPIVAYFCPICIQFKDDQQIVYMKRKGEMKNHIQKHFTDALYYCNNCPTARDRFEDLKAHCKRVHRQTLRSTAMVGKMDQLIPQELFACGFLDWTGLSYCREAFRNSKSWLDHIAEHMERGSTPAEWNYSAVIKNLLRQPELCQLWKDFLYMCEGLDKRNWTPLVWDVDRSRTLMLKLNRRDFRPGINNLLSWAHELGLPEDQPVCQPAEHGTNLLHRIPTLKPPVLNDLHGVSMDEIDTFLKRRSSISQDMGALPAIQDSSTMAQSGLTLDFITDHSLHMPQTQLQPESDSESWPNLQLASGLQGSSDQNPSIFALSENTLVQYPPQPFHQDSNLSLDADQPRGEANGPMGPDSHLLESHTHNHANFDCPMFDTSEDYHGARSMI